MFGYDEKEGVFPLRISEKEYNNYANILLIEKNNKKHYCLIKSMSRLFASQCSKRKSKIYICNYCLQRFGKEEILKDHLEYCSKHKCGKTVFPKKGEILKFKNFERMHGVPFIIYADFECYLEP